MFLVGLVAEPAHAAGIGEVDLDVGSSSSGFASPYAYRVGMRVGERIENLVVIDITPEVGVRVDLSNLDWTAIALMGGARVHASLPVSPGVYGNVGFHPANQATWFAYGLGLDGRVDRALSFGGRVGFEHLGDFRFMTLGVHLTVRR